MFLNLTQSVNGVIFNFGNLAVVEQAFFPVQAFDALPVILHRISPATFAALVLLTLFPLSHGSSRQIMISFQ